MKLSYLNCKKNKAGSCHKNRPYLSFFSLDEESTLADVDYFFKI